MLATRSEIGALILSRLEAERASIARQYAASVGSIGHFVVDNLLPDELAHRIYDKFPAPSGMRLKKTLREYKNIAAQMNNYDPILEEAIYAFQDQRIVALIAEICGIKSLYPDENLYAGGISMMGDKQYLNPHLDNSHDKDRDKWRVLNLLYYVSPLWQPADGGNLELWPDGVKSDQTTITCEFNKLAVMATHQKSWHSVSPIKSSGFRCCVSNYYFSDDPLLASDNFHVTSFRGRPEQKVVDVVLRADVAARTAVRKLFPKGVVENKHVYKRDM